MAFPEPQEVVAELESQGSESPSGDLAPEARETPEAPQIIDLSQHQKFKFDNREWTPDELKKSILRQADYTRKTQEFSQERRYYENLRADLGKVRDNPALAQEFRRVYPERFHAYLEYLSQDTKPTPATQPQNPGSNQTQYAQLDPKLVARFESLENTYFNEKVQAIESNLEAQEKELGGKFPMADLETVYSKAQAILDRNSQLPKDEHIKLTKDIWEKLYEQDHNKNKQRYESFYKTNINKQKQAGLKARDSGLGGSVPGSAPKKYKSIKEVSDALHANNYSELE